MTGERLKQIIATCGYSQKELTEKMKTVKYEQDWTRIFTSKDVKSGVLEELAAVLGISMGQLYGEEPADPATAAMATPSRYIDLLQARDRQIDKLQQHISALLKIVGEKTERTDE